MEEMPFAEPYKIKMIENLRKTTRDYRLKAIEKVGYNLFSLSSDDVYIDLLTDSGTGAMSDIQWSKMMKGDESYAGSRSHVAMGESIKDILGFNYFLPTHQGRGAENVLFSVLVKEGDVIPGNSHFDTTKGHIEFRKAIAVDCTIDEAFDPEVLHPFKGNIDLLKLEQTIEKYGVDHIPFVLITMTCNTAGGQPVSLKNIIDTYQLVSGYDIPLYFDIARFAENAFFIKSREKEYANHSIRDIVKEVMSYAQGVTMSSKKDAIANIGGFIALNSEEIFKKCTLFNIMFEGYITYGGLSGRDMEAIAQGLYEATEYDYLEYRVKQVEYLADQLLKAGIPIIQPTGGHAVYVDAKRFLPHISQNCYPAQTLAIELYIEAGVRGVEIGTVMADRDPLTRENRFPKMELLRLAIPRRVYTNNHMDVVAWGLKKVWEKRKDVKGLKITYELPILRHFTCRFGVCDMDENNVNCVNTLPSKPVC